MSSKAKLEIIAHQTVQKSGLKNLSFRTLGAEVGVKSSSVHYHFPEKSDLGKALIKRYRSELAEILLNITNTSESVHDSITKFNELFLAQCKDGRICFAGMLAAEVEYLNDPNREDLIALFNDMHTWLTDEFNRAGDDLKAELPSAILASTVLSALQGALLLDRAQVSTQHLDSVQTLVNNWFGETN